MTVAPLTLGIFGDPIAHSKSPAMHAAAFEALNLPHRYLPFEVAAAKLEAALEGARAMSFRGLNLTVPHKRHGAQWVQNCDPAAARIGAINTVVFDERGASTGHNTDGWGFARALSNLPGAPIQRAVVLGSGGASLAIVDALLHDTTSPPIQELCWVCRQPETLADRSPQLTADARVHGLAYETWSALEGASQLWVNTTTVGMHGGPSEFPVPLPLHQLDPHARVVDIVYPRPTGGLLDRVQAHSADCGVMVMDGRPMLLWQGVRALELWLELDLGTHPLGPSVIAAMARVLDI